MQVSSDQVSGLLCGLAQHAHQTLIYLDELLAVDAGTNGMHQVSELPPSVLLQVALAMFRGFP
jgi:hypothetical protein